ncbi:transcriptional regulator, LacI family [Cohaesibacter marisflavi]|uniref:Transcriptional regulator, LacI family n=1 Tax=Cohaesibacter marisflavi TaxID=655353 RepID=A0A1I5EUB2_9HYPH|nr:LacI family DNA-binding transcriptional regulator [Cohaesibacter marisflavi]SFO15095.1 transcriptional regulator, LacI family [Cohaesibacter marisflavi]
MADLPDEQLLTSEPRRARQGSQRVTLESVARLAGVAPTTVSRALNYPDKVAKKTLDRINAVIEQTGYVPNMLAGGLASNKSKLVAVIVPSLVNIVYAETVQHFAKPMKEAGYQVLQGEVGYSLEEEEQLVTAILSRRPDGIFLTGIQHSNNCRRQLLAANIPIVETWDVTPTPLDIVVGFSQQSVGKKTANYFYDKGYRNFAIVSAEDQRALIRNDSFLKTLADKGITKVPKSIVPGISNLQLGRQGVAKLLDEGLHDSLIFCSSDTLAHGVLTEVQARGLSIPDDIAIVGFGDQNFAAHTYPALSTVRIDRATMGRESASALLARLADLPVAQPVLDVGFEIIERDTA